MRPRQLLERAGGEQGVAGPDAHSPLLDSPQHCCCLRSRRAPHLRPPNPAEVCGQDSLRLKAFPGSQGRGLQPNAACTGVEALDWLSRPRGSGLAPITGPHRAWDGGPPGQCLTPFSANASGVSSQGHTQDRLSKCSSISSRAIRSHGTLSARRYVQTWLRSPCQILEGD